jgi:hypothetical protein
MDISDQRMPDGCESRYHRPPPPPPAETPLSVRVELVVLDGPEGRMLGQRQADVMRKVLRWIAAHRDPANP